MSDLPAWSSLEVAKLVVAVLTPLTVGLVGFFLQRTLAEQDRSWKAHQHLAERRLAVYNDVRKEINRIHCFVNDIGAWKEDTPESIIQYKRQVDENMHSNRAIWESETFAAYLDFMNAAFATYQGVGEDARIKTSWFEKRSGANWRPDWEKRLTGETDPGEGASHDHLIELITQDLTLREFTKPN